MSRSEIRPTFVSAPLIRLKADNRVIAHAIGINLNVNIDVQSVYTFGEYGPINIEPLQYGIVTGTMQITKLAKFTKTTPTGPEETTLHREALAKAITDSVNLTDGKMVTTDNGAEKAKIGSSNSPLADSELARHLDPKKMGFSRTFDLEIKLNHESDIPGKKYKYLSSLLLVKNCRLAGVNINISMGSLVNEPISFQGLLLIDQEKDKEVRESADFIQDGTD